jgi:hypothetical protein
VAKKTSPWLNRIVGYGSEAPDQLLANEGNWRIHPKNQQSVLGGVLAEVGIVQGVIVNNRTSELWEINKRNIPTIVDGHLRAQMAISSGQQEIPVTYIDLTPNEEAEILATFDPISALAVADRDKLEELIHTVNSGENSVQQMLEDLSKREGIIPPEFKELAGDIQNEVEMVECPKCGHKWPK